MEDSPGGGGYFPRDLREIGAVDSGCRHAHRDLAGPRSRLLGFGQASGVPAVVLGHFEVSHGTRRALPEAVTPHRREQAGELDRFWNVFLDAQGFHLLGR